MQTPAPAASTDPAWLGEAQGGLLVVAILGLSYAWPNRHLLRGKLALGIGLAAVSIVGYYSFFRGVNVTVPAPLTWHVAAWKPLLIGLFVAAIPTSIACVVLTVKNRRLERQLVEKPADPPSLSTAASQPVTARQHVEPEESDAQRPPDRNRVVTGVWTPAEYIMAWKSLTDDERLILEALWNEHGTFVPTDELRPRFRDWPPWRWNAVEYGLKTERKFMSETQRKHLRTNASVWGWVLTPEGQAVVRTGTRDRHAPPPMLRDEWLAQAERFERLRGHVSAIWQRDEESNRITWNITPMAGSSMDELQEFIAQAMLAGALLERAGVVAGPRTDVDDDWYNAVRVLTPSATDMNLDGSSDGRRHTGKAIANMERRSVLACSKLAGGARPSW